MVKARGLEWGSKKGLGLDIRQLKGNAGHKEGKKMNRPQLVPIERT